MNRSKNYSQPATWLGGLLLIASVAGVSNSGTLDIAGTLHWTRGSEDLALAVTTPTPLQFDASCLDTVQRIKGGELRAAGDFDGAAGYVRVRWTGCGKEPSFDFVPS